MSGTTTTILDQLRTAAIVRLPGCEADLLDFEIRWAVHDFLTRTTLLRESFTVPMVVSQSSYVLTPATTDGLVSMLLNVKNGFQGLELHSLAGLPATSGDPTVACMGDSRTMTVYPTPTTGTSVVLTVLAAVTTSPNPSSALSVPYVVQPYFESLLSGVLARMHAMPGKPWSNPALAIYHMDKFNEGRLRAKNAVAAGRSKGATRWRFPRFGK
jgi:hypothetical protein